MIRAADLENACAGRPGAVLGGGPSLPGDLARLPADAVLIAVNHHAFARGPAGEQLLDRADYVVFLDALEAPALDPAWGPQVSSLPHMTDIDIAGVGAWVGLLSSSTATWWADWLGCDPIILCGMDCRQGDRNHWYSAPGWDGVPAGHRDVEKHLAMWRGAFRRCRRPARIFAASGPLIEHGVFPRWTGMEAAA